MYRTYPDPTTGETTVTDTPFLTEEAYKLMVESTIMPTPISCLPAKALKNIYSWPTDALTRC